MARVLKIAEPIGTAGILILYMVLPAKRRLQPAAEHGEPAKCSRRLGPVFDLQPAGEYTGTVEQGADPDRHGADGVAQRDLDSEVVFAFEPFQTLIRPVGHERLAVELQLERLRRDIVRRVQDGGVVSVLRQRHIPRAVPAQGGKNAVAQALGISGKACSVRKSRVFAFCDEYVEKLCFHICLPN